MRGSLYPMGVGRNPETERTVTIIAWFGIAKFATTPHRELGFVVVVHREIKANTATPTSLFTVT